MRFDENNNVIDRESYKAILVGLSLGEDISYSMEELSSLAQAAGIEVIGSMEQTLDKVNSATYIGSGKIEELKEYCTNMDADLVIFNDELSGMQLRNIEDACSVKVIDRTILILDIFADRAISREGKLQVEMAQLQYRMPRLIGFGKSLSRLGGGIGTRGPGEKKLETDRRHIEHRMDDIRAELKAVKAERATQHRKREKSELPVVVLAGYTNSGKSSLMNRLLAMEEREDKQVFEKDMLFATLDPTERLITLDSRHSFILIDTVGFVGKLPHSLVEAFKSTLEVVCSADLVLHVCDASFAEKDYHIEITEKVLSELGANDKQKLLVFNKIDKAPDFSAVGYGKDCIAISAKTGEGMDELLSEIKKRIFADLELTELLIPYTRGDIVSYINGKSKPMVTEFRENGTYLKAELGSADRNRFREFII